MYKIVTMATAKPLVFYYCVKEILRVWYVLNNKLSLIKNVLIVSRMLFISRVGKFDLC